MWTLCTSKERLAMSEELSRPDRGRLEEEE